MELKELAAKRQLVELKLDSEKLVKKYGETISFYTYDRLPLTTFMEFASIADDEVKMADMIIPYVMDKDAQPIVSEDVSLPNDVLLAAFTKVVETLGKS